jgi:hypothetical protein
MNPDARILFSDGERAARDGAWATACFVEAGDAAAEVQLWKSALRCYRHALEIDLFDRDLLARIVRFPRRALSGRGWADYRGWVERVDGPHFGCRSARVVSGDLGAVVECGTIGPVLELIMSERDLVELRPDARFQGMPSAMAMIILRRALWPTPRERGDLMSVRVVFEVRERVRLDEHGDWEPIVER